MPDNELIMQLNRILIENDEDLSTESLYPAEEFLFGLVDAITEDSDMSDESAWNLVFDCIGTMVDKNELSPMPEDWESKEASEWMREAMHANLRKVVLSKI